MTIATFAAASNSVRLASGIEYACPSAANRAVHCCLNLLIVKRLHLLNFFSCKQFTAANVVSGLRSVRLYFTTLLHFLRGVLHPIEWGNNFVAHTSRLQIKKPVKNISVKKTKITAKTAVIIKRPTECQCSEIGSMSAVTMAG